jgi:hypothetical protein
MDRRIFLATGAAGLAACATPATTTAPPPVPPDGRWFIDPKRSSFSNMAFPPNMSLTLDMKFEPGAPGRIVYGSVNDTNKEKPYISNFSATLDGVPGPFEEQTRFNQISVLQLNPTEFRVLKMKDGDVVVGEFWTFLPDGKTLLRRGVGKNAEGRSRAFEEYFTRLP